MSDFSIYAITNAEGQTLDKWDVNQKLKDLGIPEDIINQGEDAIEKYAQENAIDLTSLQVKQTDETSQTQPINGASDKVKEDFEAQLTNLGIPTDVIKEGKEAVEAYAAQNGITLPQPPSGTQLNVKS
ncbi:MAG: hypothetical protein WCY19_01540 [Candidatus Gastranaerophilaceae bacterium]